MGAILSSWSDNLFEQLLFTTVRIECLDHRGIPSCVGTGFFLQKQIEAGAYKIYLVSNRHVLHDGVDSINIWFTKAKDGKPLVGQCEHILIERISQMVVPHPDVDLAILDCTALVTRFPESLYFKAVSREALVDFKEPELSVADNIYFVGYPEDIFDISTGLPLLRTGAISSLPQADFDGLPQIVIDAQVFPGSSGSPVFIRFSHSIKLLGIITASFNKHQSSLGLGIVIKATCIKKLIDDISGNCI